MAPYPSTPRNRPRRHLALGCPLAVAASLLICACDGSGVDRRRTPFVRWQERYDLTRAEYPVEYFPLSERLASSAPTTDAYMERLTALENELRGRRASDGEIAAARALLAEGARAHPSYCYGERPKPRKGDLLEARAHALSALRQLFDDESFPKISVRADSERLLQFDRDEGLEPGEVSVIWLTPRVLVIREGLSLAGQVSVILYSLGERIVTRGFLSEETGERFRQNLGASTIYQAGVGFLPEEIQDELRRNGETLYGAAWRYYLLENEPSDNGYLRAVATVDALLTADPNDFPKIYRDAAIADGPPPRAVPIMAENRADARARVQRLDRIRTSCTQLVERLALIE